MPLQLCRESSILRPELPLNNLEQQFTRCKVKKRGGFTCTRHGDKSTNSDSNQNLKTKQEHKEQKMGNTGVTPNHT